MQNIALWPNMKNKTFYGFITSVIDSVGVLFLLWNSFHSFLKHKKYDLKWPYLLLYMYKIGYWHHDTLKMAF